MATTTVPRLDVARIRGEMGLSRERMARLLDVSAKTIERWEKAAALPASERQRRDLARLREIAELGRIVYTEEGFQLFLVTPLPVFGGRSALAAIEAGEAELVLDVLAGLYEGETG